MFQTTEAGKIPETQLSMHSEQYHAPVCQWSEFTTHESRPSSAPRPHGSREMGNYSRNTPSRPCTGKLFTHDRAPCSEEYTATFKQHQVQFGLVTFSDNDEDAITKQLKKIV
jgi:hypothetical protein